MLLVVELLFIVLLALVFLMLYRGERLSRKAVVPKATIEEYWTGRERRQCVRFKKDLGVDYTIEKRPHLKNNGKVLDISESGVKLTMDEKLAKGTILDLCISEPNSRKTLKIEGEIVWFEECLQGKGVPGKRMFRCGLKFLGVRTPSGMLVSEFIRSLATTEV